MSAAIQRTYRHFALKDVTHIKGAAKTCYSPEEKSHGKVSSDNDQIESKECTGVANQTTCEIYNDAKNQDLGSCKGNINKYLCKPKCRRAVESVSTMLIDDRSTK